MILKRKGKKFSFEKGALISGNFFSCEYLKKFDSERKIFFSRETNFVNFGCFTLKDPEIIFGGSFIREFMNIKLKLLLHP